MSTNGNIQIARERGGAERLFLGRYKLKKTSVEISVT
jgi:hypothetical protein